MAMEIPPLSVGNFPAITPFSLGMFGDVPACHVYTKGSIEAPGIYARHETVQAGKKLQFIEDIEISNDKNHILKS